MGYYYHDPSGLGVWYVPDGQSPAEALDALNLNVSPLLTFSVAHTPEAQKVQPPRPAASPPPPASYQTAGQTLSPVPVPLTSYQLSNLRQPKIESTVPLPGGPEPGGGPECDFGYYYDEFVTACVPTITYPGPIAPGGPVGVQTVVTPQQIQITVNNAVNLAKGVGDEIAKAAGDAIAQAAQDATDVTQAASKAVTGAIKDTVDAISAGANSLLGGLKDGLTYIYNLVKDNISKIVSFITDHIGTIIKDVDKAINFINDKVLPKIQSVIDTVNKTLNETIVPIFKTISDVFNTVQGLISAIERDVQNGLQGILQLPADIANSLSGVEAQLDRLRQQLHFGGKDNASVTLGEVMEETVGQHLRSLGQSIISKGRPTNDITTFTDTVRLSEPDIASAGSKTFDAIWKDIATFVDHMFRSGKGFLDAIKTLPIGLPILLEGAAEWPIALIALTLGLVEAMRPLYSFIEEDIAAKAGLAKLSPGDALAAWVRGFIATADLEEDLAVNGWDKTRIQVMKDLQVYLIDTEKAIDMYFRRQITEADLRSNLVDHGIVTVDQDALLAQATKIFDVSLATRSWLWNNIDETQLDAILGANRWTDSEIAAYKATALDLGGPEDVIDTQRFSALIQTFGIRDPAMVGAPKDVLDAAKRRGQGFIPAAAAWWRSFAIPPLQEWLQLYFRGLRTLPELHAAMDFYRVPQEWRDDLIRANRSLIPFRTIPAMLQAGIIDETYATQQLQGHGYDLKQIEILLNYAKVGKKKTKTEHAVTLQTISIATAKQFFLDGAITEQQYRDALAAHGYDQATIDVTLKVETLAEHARERKQQATDIVDEALAGTITFEQAQAQFSQKGFTVEESARYLRQLVSQQRKQQKTPGEAELHTMLSHSIITKDQYRAGVTALGFAPQWVDAFVALRGG